MNNRIRSLCARQEKLLFVRFWLQKLNHFTTKKNYDYDSD